MRIWCVNPRTMCRQHLLGEHNEIHKFIGSMKTGQNLSGYYDKGLIDTVLLEPRHEELVLEMHRRGYQHKSPFPGLPTQTPAGSVDPIECDVELRRRCEECRRCVS